jgi:hypothetical protein
MLPKYNSDNTRSVRLEVVLTESRLYEFCCVLGAGLNRARIPTVCPRKNLEIFNNGLWLESGF